MKRQPLEQIETHLEKLQAEILDIEYFIANALCKETKDIYQLTLQEKQNQLHLLLFQKNELVDQLKESAND
jgi:short-subunit dehydrogenase